MSSGRAPGRGRGSEGPGGRTTDCRYWLQGTCKNGEFVRANTPIANPCARTDCVQTRVGVRTVCLPGSSCHFRHDPDRRARPAQGAAGGAPLPPSRKPAVPPSNVIVHGVGSDEDILEVLQDIEDTCKRRPDATGSYRQFDSDDEFAALLDRVRKTEAQVVLRKLFLCREKCNVMQEIWIRDKKNPLARASPLKSYAVVHVHHHAHAGHESQITPTHLRVVDAMNARHLDTAGRGYQGDNPFFDTYIEPSGRETLKVFPHGQWVCKCKQRNYWSKASCRGWNGEACKAGGTRPCRPWNWGGDVKEDEGLAFILAQADAVEQWKSKSGKSKTRTGGSAPSEDEQEEFCAGVGLDQLRKQYNELRAKVCPACCEKKCICVGAQSHAAATASSQHSTASVTNLTGFASVAKPVRWEELPAPDMPPSPHTILFVGANNDKSSQLSVEREMETIRETFWQKYGSEAWAKDVKFEYAFFTDASDLAKYLRQHDPLMLLFSCHASRSALALFEKDLAVKDFKDFVSKWVEAGHKLRVIVANCCYSGEMAKALADCVDFVIGHETPVFDEDAIKFTRELFGNLGGSESLLLSFHAGKMISDPYIMTGRKNANEFKLQPSARAEVGDQDTALITFLRSEGLSAIAVQFSDAMGMELVDDFRRLKETDFEHLGFLMPWQKQKLVRLASNLTAHALSLRDADASDSGASTRSAASAYEGSSDSEDEASTVLVAAYHVGNAEEILAHLKSLLVFEIQKEGGAGDTSQGVSFCVCLLVSFLRGAKFESPDVERDKWLMDVCERMPGRGVREELEVAVEVHANIVKQRR